MENDAKQGPPSPIAIDLLVTHGHVLTMDAAGSVIPDGAIAVSGREIVAVGTTPELSASYEAARTIDAAGAVVHPGFVECHTHVTFHLARGAFGDTMSFHDVEP